MIKAFTSRSLAAIRLAIVFRHSANRPARVFAHMCVKPRNENVSGRPRPRRLRFSAANRPNSIRRVFSALSSRPNLAKRSGSIDRADDPPVQPADPGIAAVLLGWTVTLGTYGARTMSGITIV